MKLYTSWFQFWRKRKQLYNHKPISIQQSILRIDKATWGFIEDWKTFDISTEEAYFINIEIRYSGFYIATMYKEKIYVTHIALEFTIASAL